MRQAVAIAMLLSLLRDLGHLGHFPIPISLWISVVVVVVVQAAQSRGTLTYCKEKQHGKLILSYLEIPPL